MAFKFGANELDLQRHELRRAGEVVHVEPQVFDLIAFLIANRDRIVSKDEILDAIWDGRIVSEAALSSRINAARKAIGDSGNDQIFIRTFHKRGFRFVADVTQRADEVPPGAPGGTGSVSPPPIAPGEGPTPRLRSDDGKPRIAVLPFENQGGDSEQEYFSYGLTEDIIRLLARNRWLSVLTRHSAAAFKGRDVDAAEIGAALGAKYLVRGSVRRSGEQVRIAAELVDAGGGRQLWSEVYDLRLEEIFDIQNAMAEQIAAFIEPELGMVERDIAARKAPENLAAWECYQRGFWHLWGFTKPGFAEAEALFRRATEIEPGLARAHAALSYVYLQTALYADHTDRPRLLQAALAAGRSAVGLDERDCLCRCVLGRAYTLLKNHDEAIAELERTIELNPSFAQGYFAFGFALVWAGRAEEAIPLLERATELSPRDPHLWTFHHMRATAHFALEELETAAHFERKAIREPSATYYAYATLLATLGLSKTFDEASEVRAALLAKRPAYTQTLAREDLFYCSDQRFIDRYLEGLREAGVPA
jgi:TolB-like protein/DNA-binding winged helix-turn-helix (wHTH) protein/Flp pilus assembly protein TadD